MKLTGEKMEKEIEMKPWAQKGTHKVGSRGFYSKELDKTRQRYFQQATEFDGLDSEIALLRVMIKSLIARDPENLKLISQASNSLARLVTAKYHISKTDKQSFEEAALNVLKDIAVPLGFGALPVLKK